MAEGIGPGGPGRALQLDLECRTSRASRRGRAHPVTITADWRFESPHDLDAERVAVAFGGFTSCLEVADRILPALREAVHLLARQVPVCVSPVSGRGWMVSEPVTRCDCHRMFYRSAAAAARHARSNVHLTRKYAADERLLGALLDAAAEQYDEFPRPDDPDRSLARLVREVGGPAELWGSGVHPDSIREMAELVPGCTEPLPVAFYLGVASREVDREWLAATLARRPDPDVAAWLAWSDEAVQPTSGTDCAEWLSLGVPLRSVQDLLGARTKPRTVRRLGRRTGLSDRSAAAYLANWAQAGCEPTAEHVSMLDRLGIDRGYRPPVTAINLLEVTASVLPDPPSRTDLAVMLALVGTRTGVLELLERGVTTPDAALSAL